MLCYPSHHLSIFFFFFILLQEKKNRLQKKYSMLPRFPKKCEIAYCILIESHYNRFSWQQSSQNRKIPDLVPLVIRGYLRETSLGYHANRPGDWVEKLFWYATNSCDVMLWSSGFYSITCTPAVPRTPLSMSALKVADTRHTPAR